MNFKLPDRASWLTLLWRTSFGLRYLGRARLAVLAVVVLALGWHFVVLQPQNDALRASVAQLTQAQRTAPHPVGPSTAEAQYGARYAMLLAILQRHGLNPQRTGFDSSTVSGGRVYSFDLALTADYSTLYQALLEVQQQAQTRVTRLRLERESEQTPQVHAQVRISFSGAP